MQGHAYNAVERALHHLALGSRPVAELCFDLNLLLSPGAGESGGDERHVFVSGLARAGTTIIMRRLHETGAFRSLTYRDMPFVLCPNLWRRISALSPRSIAAVERAHGDSLQVDVDSPEALDEVFWRVFAGDDYIKADHLRPHAVDAELVGKFRRYISCILHAPEDGQPRSRYLSKNNNSILRLAGIAAAFPKSVILIPFRDPVQHAASLLNQHRKFSEIQGENEFARSYMRWLAHHEFGREFKPFWFAADQPVAPSAFERSDINFWIETWLRVYGWIRDSKPADAVLVCYEDLCADPAIWRRIAELADVADAAAADGARFSRATDRENPEPDRELLAAARELYGELRREAGQALG